MLFQAFFIPNTSYEHAFGAFYCWPLISSSEIAPQLPPQVTSSSPTRIVSQGSSFSLAVSCACMPGWVRKTPLIQHFQSHALLPPGAAATLCSSSCFLYRQWASVRIKKVIYQIVISDGKKLTYIVTTKDS